MRYAAEAAAGGAKSGDADGAAAVDGASSAEAAGASGSGAAEGASSAAAATSSKLRQEPEPKALEFRVKISDMAYVHAQWLREATLVTAMEFMPSIKTKYRNFMQRVEATGGVEALAEADESNGLEHGVSPDWVIAERVIAFDESDGAAAAPRCRCLRRP